MRTYDKINAIHGINSLLNFNINKTYTNKQRKEIRLKSPKETQELYGINIGNNLIINARALTNWKFL